MSLNQKNELVNGQDDLLKNGRKAVGLLELRGAEHPIWLKHESLPGLNAQYSQKSKLCSEAVDY